MESDSQPKQAYDTWIIWMLMSLIQRTGGLI